MPDRTLCKLCGKVGLVRREQVIKGGKTTIVFYCGACNRSWEVEENSKRDPKNE